MRTFSDRYLTALIGPWAQVSEATVRRLSRAVREIDERRYGPAQLMSDVLGFWIESARGPWSAFGLGEREIQHVLFVINQDTEGHQKLVDMDVPGRGIPQVSDLFGVWSTAGNVLKAWDGQKGNVQVKTTPERDALMISLVGLQPQKPLVGEVTQSLAAGLYQGLIYVEEQPLAVLYVVVRQTPSSSGAYSG